MHLNNYYGFYWCSIGFQSFYASEFQEKLFLVLLPRWFMKNVKLSVTLTEGIQNWSTCSSNICRSGSTWQQRWQPITSIHVHTFIYVLDYVTVQVTTPDNHYKKHNHVKLHANKYQFCHIWQLERHNFASFFHNFCKFVFKA